MMISEQSLTVTETVVFSVPGHYGYGPEFNSFAEAVGHARSLIQTFRYGDKRRSSTEYVDMRVRSRTVGQAGTVETVATRWAVFADAVVVVPEGQGGLTRAQEDLLLEQDIIHTVPAGR